MSDSRLLAEQQIWAGTTEGAKNQAFNCSNGDFFTWKGLWKVLCELFDVDFVDLDDAEKFDAMEMMSGMGDVWDEIVEKFQHVCSMNKSREFGFVGFYDTFKSVRYWVGKMREMKIIP
ncbi:unnamed protein product [Linum tenue]|uniref:Uncharacterized protein n=1 Tax=Linum tenue TaxID=586396 RepID=A0AAV0R1R6_9ROSI|nr:unnamed protein product [Linum tenue]